MDTRRYKKFTEVFRDLVTFCSKLADSGSAVLPHERELAALLDCSRMTLRKALTVALQQKMLRRRGRFLELYLPGHNLSDLGKILFVATGSDDRFYLNALNKLYTSVSDKLKKYNARLELLLTNTATSEDFIRERCMDADIILFTLFVTENHDADRQRLFWEIGRQRRVIALSDPYQEFFHNFIALDNFKVGELAASELHHAGCRKIGCVSGYNSSVIFRKRADGFCNYFSNIGVDVWLPRESGSFPRQFSDAVNAGCDGIFLVSDEYISAITADYFASGAIPGKLKLITVDGCGEARRHQPPITCVGHGTRAVAAELVDYLIHLSEQSDWPDCRKLITPELHPGETL